MKDKAVSLLRGIGKLLSNASLSTTQKSIFNENNSEVITTGTASGFITKGETFGNNNILSNRNFWVSRVDVPITCSYAPGFSLTTDSGVISGGSTYNGSPGAGPSLMSTYKYNETSSSWTARTNALYYLHGRTSFGVTTDTGIFAGGSNYSSHYSYTDRFTESANIWTSRSDISGTIGPITFAPVGLRLESTSGLLCCGEWQTGPQKDVAGIFNDSINSWVKTNGSQIFHFWTGFSIKSYLAIIVGNGLVEKFNQVGYTWTNVAKIHDQSSQPRNYMGGWSCQNGYGIIAAGSEGTTIVTTTEKYSLEENIWTLQNDISIYTSYPFTIELESNGNGLLSAGNRGTLSYPSHIASSSKFFDNNFYDGQLVLPYFYSSSIDRNLNSFLTTETLTNKKLPIKSVLVSSSVTNEENKIYYGVSIDDGNTWKDNIKIGDICDTRGLLPSTDGYYKLKIRLDVVNSSNYWQYRTNYPLTIASGSGFAFTSDKGVSCGGRDGSATYYSDAFHYSRSQNSWNTTTGQIYLTYRPANFGLSTNFGYILGGKREDEVNILSAIQRYSCHGGIWRVMTATTSAARYEFAGAGITGDIGIFFGGTNDSSYLSSTYTFQESTDQILSKSSIPIGGLWEQSAGYLTSDMILSAGGTLNAGTDSNNLIGFTFSSNIWTSLASMDIYRNDMVAFSLTSDFFATSGGHNSTPTYYMLTRVYSYSRNMWIYKANITESKQHSHDMSFTPSIGMATVGINGSSTYSSTTLQYYFNDVSFYSFVVTDFDGEKICQ